MALNLVTGGCGFIGTHLVKLLKKEGEAVRVLDAKPPVERVPGVDYRTGSIIDRFAAMAACDGCRRVFHLAALSGLWGPDKDAFIRVNRDGTRNVLEASAQCRVETVVHTSTESVLVAMGRGRRPQVITEDTRCSLREMAGAYCRGKYLAEAEAAAAADRGQRVVIASPTVPAGPGDHWITPPTRMILGFLNRAYPAYLDSTLNLADARDIALGLRQAAERGRPGARYVLSAHDVRIGALLEMLECLSGRPLARRRIPYPVALAVSAVSELVSDWITRRPPAAPLSGVRLAGVPVRFDNTRTRQELDWTPRPLKATLRDAITDYQARGLVQ